MKPICIYALAGCYPLRPAVMRTARASRRAARPPPHCKAPSSPRLQAARKAGGPVNPIEVCNKKAPAISAEIAGQYGRKIGRTSLKVRIPKNTPDAWEVQVLQDFEKRKAAGEDPAQFEHYAVVEQDSKKVFRYMKALPIPAGAPCLTCHGEKLDPAVAARLKELYPHEQATGFKPGGLRGAVTIIEPL
jgi:hypothetical protein